MFPSDDAELWKRKQELKNAATSWDTTRRDTTHRLRDLARQLDKFQREIEEGKKRLALTGMMGGGLTLIGVGLSFVTAGASLGLVSTGMALTGAGFGIASGVGGFYQQGKEKEKNEEIVNKADEAVKKFTKLSEQFINILKELQKIAQERNIELEFIVDQDMMVKASTGVVVCSGAMMSAFAGLGLLAANTGLAAAQAFNPGTLSVVSLLGNTVIYFGITNRLATGVSSMQGLATRACAVASKGMRLVNSAGKAVKVVGGTLAVFSVGLDFKAYVDASMNTRADKPSKVAEKIREMAEELECLSR